MATCSALTKAAPAPGAAAPGADDCCGPTQTQRCWCRMPRTAASSVAAAATALWASSPAAALRSPASNSPYSRSAAASAARGAPVPPSLVAASATSCAAIAVTGSGCSHPSAWLMAFETGEQ